MTTPAPGHTKPWHRLVALLLREDGSGTAWIRRMVPPPSPRSFRKAGQWLADRGMADRAILCAALAREIHGAPRKGRVRVQRKDGIAGAWVRMEGVAAPGDLVEYQAHAGAVVVTPVAGERA